MSKISKQLKIGLYFFGRIGGSLRVSKRTMPRSRRRVLQG